MILRLGMVMLGILYLQISYSQDSTSFKNIGEIKIQKNDEGRNDFLSNFKSKISGNLVLGFENYSNDYLLLEENKTNFFWRSDLGFSLFKIPFGFNFNHSTLEQLNYNKTFRLFFDKNKFDKLKKKEILSSENTLTTVRDSLYKLKQSSTKKLAYSEYKLKNFKKPDFKKGEELKVDSSLIDSVTFDPEVPDTSKLYHVSDSLELLFNLAKYKKEIAELDEKIKEVERKPQIQRGNYSNKKRSLFENIRTLEVGYSYPSYSRFLVRGNLLKGINVEYEDNIRYLAFSYGKIAKNFPSSKFQNPFEQFTSFFNTDYSLEKDIIAAKTGIGKRYGTHFFIGGLLGKGSTGNYFTSGSLPVSKNIVLEADASLEVNKRGNLNIIYGKSFLSRSNFNQEQLEFVSDKTNVIESAFTYRINHVVDKIELKGKYSDPLFKSFGINYISTNYLIYEIEAHKRLNNKLKIEGGYKKENYNIQENDLPVRINSLIFGFDYRITRKLKLISSIQPSLSANNNFNNNFLSNILVNYFEFNKDYQLNITSSFNDFRVINDTANFNIQNYLLGSSYSINKSTFEGSVMHLKSDNKNSNYETIYNLDFSYLLNESMSFLIGAKLSFNHLKERSDGFILKFDYNSLLQSRLSLSGLYEKRVVSEMYYMNFINPEIFKYYSKVQLTYNF